MRVIYKMPTQSISTVTKRTLILLARDDIGKSERELRKVLESTSCRLEVVSSKRDLIGKIKALGDESIYVMIHQLSIQEDSCDIEEFIQFLQEYKNLRDEKPRNKLRLIVVEPDPKEGYPFRSYGDIIDMYLQTTFTMEELLYALSNL